MFCKSPIITPNTGRDVPVPCGQCLPCRINKRRIWTHRQMLEKTTSPSASFLTLTYRPEDIPDETYNPETGQVYERASVAPSDHKRFIDHLRTAFRRSSGGSIRYFMCGEYGEKTGRPHYHYALFGYPSCLGPGAQTINGKFTPCTCPNCSLVAKVWGKGNVFLGTLTQHSAQYVAGYVTKKLTANNDYTNRMLGFRHPEFTRQSRMPGLGHDAAVQFGQQISPFVNSYDDIPPFLVHNGKKWPLGRYLHGKVAQAAGLPPLQEGEAISRYKKSLHELFESSPLATPYWLDKAKFYPDIVLRDLNAQKVLRLEKKEERNRISKQGV